MGSRPVLHLLMRWANPRVVPIGMTPGESP
jgi:hypothetical protein